MRKLIVLFSAVFLLSALTGASAWAANPDTSVLDRHAVWSKIIKDNKKMISQSENQVSAETSKAGQANMEGSQSKPSGSENQLNTDSTSEDHVKMDVQIKDLPWQRVG